MKGLLVLLILSLSATAVYADIYTWKDNKGTRFYTNSLHEIPARYLKKARLLDVATGKVGGLATKQPAVTAAPAPGATAPARQPQLVQQAPAAQIPPQRMEVPPVQAAPAAVPVAEPAATRSAEAARPQRERMSRKELRAQGRRHSTRTEE